MTTRTHFGSAARAAFRGALRGSLALLVVLAATGCDLNLENPNAPPESEVISNVDGMYALAVGMQGQYSNTIDDYLTTNSLGTDEWGTRSKALISYQEMFTLPSIDNSYLLVEEPWANSYETIKSANTILANIDQLGLGTGLRNQFTALAKLFKAMSYGMLVQQYEQVPITVGSDGAGIQPREMVLDTVLSLLSSANDDLQEVTDADIAQSRARLLGTGFDLRNTVSAMLARYSLMAGDYQQAIDAADAVDLGVLSVFEFPPPTRNPIENLAFQLGYVGALKSFVTEAEPGDQRPAYWVNVAAAPLPANPADSVILPLAKYSLPDDPFPVYLPDEMKLVKAEALTRMNEQLDVAAGLVNEVRTQTSSPVDEPLAGLSALPASALDTQDELLAEIAKQRRYELFEQGLRWEDTRRFGDALTTTPTVEFLPIPQQECLTNTSHPCG
jgi:hypothetical protein